MEQRALSAAASAAAGESAAPATSEPCRVAVAQMTSVGSTESNFAVVAKLAKVWSVPGCGRQYCRKTEPATHQCHPSRVGFLHLSATSHSARPLAPMQAAAEQGCRMLFLPENVSFLGTSSAEVGTTDSFVIGMV